MKKCTKCNILKPLSTFYKRGDQKGSNIRSRCKKCATADRKEYYYNNLDKVRNWHIIGQRRRKSYCEPDEYNRLLDKQKNLCAICKQVCSTGRSLAADHDHKTRQVRGLLCMMCNTGLGKFKDSTHLLKEAIKYLNETH